MSPDAYTVFFALAGGIVAGVVFFGGLYLTTQRIATARRPTALVLTSLVSRMALVVTGAWLVGRAGSYVGLLVYVAGMIGVRVMLVARIRRREGAESA